jgi:hypothetical protein
VAAEKERKKLRLVKGMKITSDLAIPEQSDMPKSEESIPKLLVLGQCVGLALFSAPQQHQERESSSRESGRNYPVQQRMTIVSRPR